MSKPSVTCTAAARIPTRYGEFQLCYYTNTEDDKEHLAFFKGDVGQGDAVMVRVHSECFTGDVLGSLRCDCGEQLDRSLALIAQEGRGAVVYLRQEGRGIGLAQKLRAYNLQDQGYDTVDANLMLGHGADERRYALAACILEELGVGSVRLITNNPAKIQALREEGVNVVARVPLEVALNVENQLYLQTKVQRMEHMLKLKPFAKQHGSELHEHQYPN
ncbi:MAG TPA: GTP cyclohydrolase II [Dongiaceae bacterium]|nr:GTP cyclohydrolase II [Dongiaceae bacterium]